MELDKKLEKIFKRKNRFIPFPEILHELNRKGTVVGEHELEERLAVSDRYLEVADGIWSDAAALFSGVSFFAVVEPDDFQEGVVYLSGDELLLLTDTVARHGRGTVLFGSDEVDIYPGVTSDGIYYLGGFQRFFAAQSAPTQAVLLLFSVEDYGSGLFRGELCEISRLESLLDLPAVRVLPDKVMAYLKESEDYDLLVLDGEEESVAVDCGEMLLYMLYLEEWDFAAIPANISYYLGFDSRFQLVAGEHSGDGRLSRLGEYYMGGPMQIDMEQPDLDLLNRALDHIYRQTDPEEGMYLLKELKLRHPGVPVLNKFLYQAAYELDNDREVLEYAEIYSRHFTKDPDPFVVRADIFLKQDFPDRAEESLIEARDRIHPGDRDFLSEMYTLWVYLMIRRQDLPGAVSMARSALLANPANREAAEFLESQGYSTDPDSVKAAEQQSRIIHVDFNQR